MILELKLLWLFLDYGHNLTGVKVLMTVFSYIKKGYPIPLKEQLEISQIANSDELYIERENFLDNQELKDLFNRLKQDDTLIVYSFKTLLFGKKIVHYLEELQKKHIRLICISDNVDTNNDPIFYRRVIWTIHSQRNWQSDLTKFSLGKKKAEGKILGRPKISGVQILEIKRLRKEERRSIRDIAIICGVSVGTVYKYIN